MIINSWWNRIRWYQKWRSIVKFEEESVIWLVPSNHPLPRRNGVHGRCYRHRTAEFDAVKHRNTEPVRLQAWHIPNNSDIAIDNNWTSKQLSGIWWEISWSEWIEGAPPGPKLLECSAIKCQNFPEGEDDICQNIWLQLIKWLIINIKYHYVFLFL